MIYSSKVGRCRGRHLHFKFGYLQARGHGRLLEATEAPVLPCTGFLAPRGAILVLSTDTARPHKATLVWRIINILKCRTIYNYTYLVYFYISYIFIFFIIYILLYFYRFLYFYMFIYLCNCIFIQLIIYLIY